MTARPPSGDPQLKNEIWKIQTAPKLKHFLWRMLSRALATGEELERRRINPDKFCKRCVTEIESTDHIFFTCPHALQIWRASMIPIRCLTSPHVNLEAKMMAIFEWNKLVETQPLQSQQPLWI